MIKKRERIEQAYLKSQELLHQLKTEYGFIASVNNVSNYKRIWSRDGVTLGLASLATGDKELIKTFEKTLLTLKKFQDTTGRIPSNVSLNKISRVSYGTTVGRVDATIWYIIGITQLILQTNNQKFFQEFRDSLKKAFFYLECLELNGKGLLYIPQGGDWSDEYINHGYVLFDQVLYYLALDSYAKITKEPEIIKRRNHLKKVIAVNYFPSQENLTNPNVYNKLLFEKSLKLCKTSLTVAYFTSYSVSCHTANFANSLLLLSGILESEQEEKLQKNIQKTFMHSDFPIIPAFYPVIDKKDLSWHELENNFLFNFKNQPYNYQNGGLWPWIQGFFLASLRSSTMEKELYLKSWAEVLARDDFIFPEYYHGKNHQAKGVMKIGHSAAGYILAYNSIIKNKKVFL